MKLLLTTDAVGGVATYSDDLTAALERRGMEVFQAVMGPSGAQSSAHRINTGLPLDWLAERPDEVIDASLRLAALASELGVDLVQLHAPALAAADAFAVPVLSVVHSCVATWWSAVRQGPLPTDLAWRAEQTRRGIEASALVVAPTEAFAEAVRTTYGLACSPVAVHNGKPPSDIVATVQADAVLAIGRLWDEGKNVAMLDAAASMIDAPVCAVGPSDGPNGTSTRLSHLEVPGYLMPPALKQRYAARPIFVSPALYEPFGLAVLEAAQAGCALVLSDIPTFRELWDGAAAFVSPRDPQGLANAVNALLQDRLRRGSLGREALKRASSYSVDRTADAMLRHYRALLSGEKRHAA